MSKFGVSELGDSNLNLAVFLCLTCLGCVSKFVSVWQSCVEHPKRIVLYQKHLDVC